MKDCKIVQDLMPNYIDNLTSEETNNFIKEHLENCENCTNFYNEMKGKITLKNKDTIKQEIDYMKKAKKKMNIGKKLLTIICLLFIILVVLFWREAYNAVCYADICMKYLIWQDAVLEEGGYYEYNLDGMNKEVIYFTKDMVVNLHERRDNVDLDNNGTSIQAFASNSDVADTIILYDYDLIEDGKIRKDYLPANLGYDYTTSLSTFPKYFRFNFDNKASFWDLISTIGNVRYIWTTKDNKGVEYYVVNLKDDTVVKVNKETGVPEYVDEHRVLLSIPSMKREPKIDSFLEKLNSDDVVWDPYEDLNKDVSVPNNAVSSSNAKAGEIVTDTFKIKAEDNASLKGFKEVPEDNNFMYLKITTLTTYNQIKERWSFLRDLTEEDFKHYTVMIVIDKDKTKEIESISIVDAQELYAHKAIKVKEKNATEEIVYSGVMVTIPNNEIYQVGELESGEKTTYPLRVTVIK